MDPSILQTKLIKAARLDVSSDAVPYAFEKGVMARLESRGIVIDGLAYWTRSLWRAVAPCAGIALLLGAWTFLGQDQDNPEEFAQHFESTVLAGVATDPSIE